MFVIESYRCEKERWIILLVDSKKQRGNYIVYWRSHIIPKQFRGFVSHTGTLSSLTHWNHRTYWVLSWEVVQNELYHIPIPKETQAAAVRIRSVVSESALMKRVKKLVLGDTGIVFSPNLLRLNLICSSVSPLVVSTPILRISSSTPPILSRYALFVTLPWAIFREFRSDCSIFAMIDPQSTKWYSRSFTDVPSISSCHRLWKDCWS